MEQAAVSKIINDFILPYTRIEYVYKLFVLMMMIFILIYTVIILQTSIVITWIKLSVVLSL